jgi:hypothetical protein
MRNIILFLILLFVYVLVDIIVISRNIRMWDRLRSSVMSTSDLPPVSKMAGLIAWFLIVLGMYVFVIDKIKSLKDVFIYGVIYAIVIYGVFDFTNVALFSEQKYPWDVVLTDIISGIITTVLTLLFFFYLKQSIIT